MRSGHRCGRCADRWQTLSSIAQQRAPKSLRPSRRTPSRVRSPRRCASELRSAGWFPLRSDESAIAGGVLRAAPLATRRQRPSRIQLCSYRPPVRPAERFLLPHHLEGKRRHRLSDHGMIHDPALVEVADKLVQPIFAAQRLHPIDTIIGITEYPYLAVEVFVLHPLERGQDLAKGL